MSVCPYCLAQIEPEDEVVACRMCNTPHHAECWTQNKGCCVRTCEEVSRVAEIDLPSESRETLVLSREAVESARAHRPERTSNPCMTCGKQVSEGELHCMACEPGPPENQDAKNLGPILVMLALAAIVIGWLVIGGFATSDEIPSPQTHLGDKRDQR